MYKTTSLNDHKHEIKGHIDIDRIHQKGIVTIDKKVGTMKQDQQQRLDVH